MIFYVYLIISKKLKKNVSYVGYTNNIEKRIIIDLLLKCKNNKPAITPKTAELVRLGLNAIPVKNDIATETKTDITILHIPPRQSART